MINGLTHEAFILNILRDRKAHYSREFVQGPEGEPRLLDYRRRISTLRERGFDIRPMNINGRPAYQLLSTPRDLFTDGNLG